MTGQAPCDPTKNRTGASTQPRLVGRSPELEVITSELRRISEGQFRLVLIDGSAGVGKSRLMDESLSRSDAIGEVLSARCYRLGRTSSFGPWLEALDRHALTTKRGWISPGYDAADAEPDRDALLESIVSVLDRLSTETLTVIAIDDIHLADATSWEALRFLARRLSNHRVGVIATARSGGLASSALATDVLHALDDDDSLRRINIRPLTEAEVSELVRDRVKASTGTSAAIPKALTRWLFERSLGHPLFVVTLLDALLAEGGDPAAPALSSIPDSLRDRVAVELPLFPVDALRVIEALAVMDQRAHPVELTAVLDMSQADVGLAVESLAKSHFVVEHSGGAGFSYEIAHPLIQESIYDLIGGARKMAIHRAVARVLIGQGRRGAAAPHLAKSSVEGDDEILTGLCEAITEAESKGLYREALQILGRLPELVSPGDERWLRVLDAITWQADWVVDHLAEGDAEGAITAMRRIEEVCLDAGDRVALGTVQFHLASFLAIGVGRLDEAEAACEFAIRLFHEAGETYRELLARNELVWITSCNGELGRSESLAAHVLADVDHDQQPVVVNQAAGSRAYALGLMGHFESSDEHYRLANRMAAENDLKYRLVWGLVQRSPALATRGDLRGASESIESALDADYSLACDALALERKSHNLWLQGKLKDCVSLVDESGARRSVRGSRRRAWGLCLAARALAEMGKTVRSSRYLAQANETYTGDEILDWSAWRQWSGGHLKRVLSEDHEARRLYEMAAARYRSMGALPYESLVLFEVSELALETRDQRMADRVAARLENIAGQIDSPLITMLAKVSAGIREICERDATSVDLSEPRDWLEGAGFMMHAATTGYLAGLGLLVDSREEAVGVLETAARSADRCGAVWRRNRILDVLNELGSAGRRVAGAVLGPQSLTARERDVAILAAAGHTASQIGEKLYIGTRTVETHLANIYPKLGVASKQELILNADDLDLRASP